VKERTRIPWTRIGAESAAIVLSILLAFWIDSSWERRLEREEAREVLSGLEVEFVALADNLDRTGRRYALWRDRLREVLETDPTNVSVAKMDTALIALIWPTTFDPGTRNRDALLESGRLELLESRPLRNRLSSWGSVLDETRDNEESMRTLAIQVTAPFLASRGVETGRSLAYTGAGRDLTFPVEETAIAAERYRLLLIDPEFRSLAQYRMGFANHSAQEFHRAADAAREVLVLTRRELGGTSTD